jgi:hypothetical protein
MQNHRRRADVQEAAMNSKWLMQNRHVLRLVSSVGGMSALALVLAAPGKWH